MQTAQNRAQDIEVHLAELRRHLLPMRRIGVRTDYIVVPTGANRRVLVLEAHQKANKFALVSSRAGLRERGVAALRNNTALNEDECQAVLNAAEALSEINDLGAWPLVTFERPPRVASSAGVSGCPCAEIPGYQRAFDTIRSALPHVDRVEILESRQDPKGGGTRKGWMHFYGPGGEQWAAVSTNLLGTMLRDWFSGNADAYPIADKRLGRWAKQVGADLPAFIEAAMDLRRLDSIVGVSEVRLENRL